MTSQRTTLLALLSMACLSVASVALAEDARSLAPSYLEARQRVLARTAVRLEQTLRLLPDVLAARVQIGQADASHAQLDETLPKPRMSAWLKLSGPGPRDETVRALLASAVPEISPETIHIARQRQAPPQASPPALHEVGPFRVTADTAPWLRVLLASLFTSNVVLCTIIFARLPRARP